MKKRWRFLLCLALLASALTVSALALSELPITAAYFPDAALREYVRTNFDTDESGLLSEEEIAGITAIDVSWSQVRSLDGIKYFTSLKTLKCSHIQLTSLRLLNTSLEELDCSENQLSGLDFSRCPLLSKLDCSSNQLTTLDVSSLSNLAELECSINRLTELRLPSSNGINLLSCGTNQLMELDLSGCHRLRTLFCYDNRLSSLDLPDSLKLLSCNGNRISSLTLPTSLTFLSCYNNRITQLNIGHCAGLKECYNGRFSVFSDRTVCFTPEDSSSENRLYADLTTVIKSTAAEPPSITSYTGDVTVSPGTTTLSVMAANGIEFQWYKYNPQNAMTGWYSVYGETSYAYTFDVTAEMDGYKYLCLVKNAGGCAATGVMTLNVLSLPTILFQPYDSFVLAGGETYFYVNAIGANRSYRWQIDNGSWQNLSDNETYTGTDTAWLKILSADLSMNGNRYRCVISNSVGTVYTQTVTLTVEEYKPLRIIQQPQDVTVTAGDEFRFSIQAECSDEILYNWQLSRDQGATWTPYYGGEYGPFITTMADNGLWYRCRLIGGEDEILSDSAVLTVVKTVPEIKRQPEDQIRSEGYDADFTVEAIGGDLAYQWQSRGESGSWTNSDLTGNKTNTLTVTAAFLRNGTQYRCVISNSMGTVNSSPASLTVLTTRVGWQKIEGTWYYFTDGKAAVGWKQISGKWYFFDPSGAMQVGWKQIGGKWYYLNSSGAMVTGWQTIGGKTYYFQSSGAMVTGMQQIAGKWYCFESSGAQYKTGGWKQVSGKWYYLDSAGVAQTGWKQISGKWYWFDSSARMATGWKQISGKWYWFNSSGGMVTGWQKVDGKWYYFASSGVMQTGWQTIGGKTYYLGTDGGMVTGMQQIGGKWYYFDSAGVQYKTAGWKQISGKWYYFDSAGVAKVGWLKESGKWYYFNDSAQMVTGWQKISGKWYWFSSGGVMFANGDKTIGGKTYHFDANGVCTNP